MLSLSIGISIAAGSGGPRLEGDLSVWLEANYNGEPRSLGNIERSKCVLPSREEGGFLLEVWVASLGSDRDKR